MERRGRSAIPLLGLVDGGGALTGWGLLRAEFSPALGLLFKDKMKPLTETTPSSPTPASVSLYPYGVPWPEPSDE